MNLQNSKVMTPPTKEERVLPSGDRWELEELGFISPPVNLVAEVINSRDTLMEKDEWQVFAVGSLNY